MLCWEVLPYTTHFQAYAVLEVKHAVLEVLPYTTHFQAYAVCKSLNKPSYVSYLSQHYPYLRTPSLSI